MRAGMSGRRGRGGARCGGGARRLEERGRRRGDGCRGRAHVRSARGGLARPPAHALAGRVDCGVLVRAPPAPCLSHLAVSHPNAAVKRIARLPCARRAPAEFAQESAEPHGMFRSAALAMPRSALLTGVRARSGRMLQLVRVPTARPGAALQRARAGGQSRAWPALRALRHAGQQLVRARRACVPVWSVCVCPCLRVLDPRVCVHACVRTCVCAEALRACVCAIMINAHMRAAGPSS